MKKIITFIVFSLAMCGFAVAKSPFAEFEKVREIKLLESSREDVKRILADYEHNKDDDEFYEQSFSTKNAEIEITYSSGDCSDSSQYWNVAEWIVIKIEISPDNPLKVKNIKFDFSNFTKEIEDEEVPEDYIYQDENSGIVFKIIDNEIKKIILFPSKNITYLLCENEKTKEISSNETRLVDSILRDEYVCGLVNEPPTVDDVIINTTEIIIGCDNENKSCADSDKEISVTTVATDRENDVLTYSYEVSGGKIFGSGAKVIWDLSSVKAGTYIITVGADDGCGICNPAKTQTVVVKECADCK